MARDPNRRQLNFTTTKDLHEQIHAVCMELDVPVSVWLRNIIKRELENPTMKY